MARIQRKDSGERTSKKAKGKGGRPKVGDEEKKNKPVTSYFTVEEQADLSEFLKGSPHTISSFMRECALEKMKAVTSNEKKKKKDKKKYKKKSNNKNRTS